MGPALMKDGVAVFPPAGGNPASQLVGQGLHPVADAQHWHPPLQHIGGDKGRPRLVDAGRPSREDEAFDVQVAEGIRGGIVRVDFAVDPALPHPPGDEASVLGPEVEHHDGLTHGTGVLTAFGQGLALALARDLQVGGDLQVVAGRHPAAHIGGGSAGAGLLGGHLGHSVACGAILVKESVEEHPLSTEVFASRFPPALEQALQEAVAVLAGGGIVAFPTDTVYGLGGDVFREEAGEKVFLVKGRPEGMPLPVLLAFPQDVERVAVAIPPVAYRLMERFWPGGLTLVLPKAPAVPAIVAARGWTVGVRVPNHPVPRELARRLGSPIHGTSANPSGAPACRTAQEVKSALGGRVDYILDGGPAPGGQSTVVDLTGPQPRLVRQGVVPAHAIEEVLGAPLKGGAQV
ncbi:Putative threonylcarbamoyl-AMP synthase [bacterium HR23]|nr:Putative threonylcarbamoyl-AMP synthase [bacterium HR23]